MQKLLNEDVILFVYFFYFVVCHISAMPKQNHCADQDQKSFPRNPYMMLVGL